MINNNSHSKAITITLFLSVAFALFVSSITLTSDRYRAIASNEKFYQMDAIIHEKPEEKKDQSTPQHSSKTTNEAYNKAYQPKHIAEASKTVTPPDNFEFDDIAELEYELELEEETSNNTTSLDKEVTLDDFQLTAYNSVNSILSKRSKSIKATKTARANTNSSIYYSLQNRTHNYLPIPVYLCNSDGKIVVNIVVNAYGIVTKATINSSSTSSNACLIEHALEYAKETTFNGAENNAQIGTITFNFKGK